ncbi:DNA-binding SARP family transcriptional activator [Streptosporangium becharense]|uniref:DNA-binding SARP family transcriptional activator n=1 Tax=Streptosporangium becharense TaxID=1816182 RepID=A0A7W9MHH4_9ACTN|nr:BTAD domain-containing putative transcriptional regulator [Streptosporangium becharense]MBB2913452.1 DNA-binding SARP family transcriptional activator [Streptosporangium becharense]MBB5821142.1 DNA-binding SARP family transcriptional activator [Streptosporangium becharense]
MLRVLGPLQAEIKGRTVDLGTHRQRAVVARLVVAGGHVVSTDRFIDDLWHGQPPPKALAALQVYVSNLRRVLEPGRPPRAPATVLVSAAPGYRLRLEPERVDAWLFPRLVDAAGAALAAGDGVRALETVDQALALWQGPAYAEFADDGWAESEATRLEELRLVAVEYRAEALLALGGNAEIELEQHVRAHPLRENAVRLLALAYYRAGRQADALATIRKARETLADELGVDPGPALRALEADILAHAGSLGREEPPISGVPASTAGPGRMPAYRAERAVVSGAEAGRMVVSGAEAERAVVSGTEPVSPREASERAGELVGRTAELETLHALAGAPGVRTVWVGGDAGAGKSTLVAAFARRLADRGWLTATGQCPETDGGAPPAWAWSEVVRHLAAERPPEDAVAARLAPLLADDVPAVASFLLARATEDYLSRIVRGSTPLLIVLEDVHRADGETLQLLRHLATRLTTSRIMIVATYRPVEAADHLGATWAALAGHDTHRVDLRGLDDDDVARLLRERSGRDVDPVTARTVAERTGGNPLFVSETARLIATEGTSAARALPPGVRDLIRRRIARLPAAARTTLRDAAIVGRDVDVDVLLALDGADEDTVLDGLEAGVLTGLLTEPAPGRVRFAHVLVRETLYEDTPRIRRTRLHGRVFGALERVRSADVSALGYHALAAVTANTAGRAVPYAVAAGERAAGLHAYREAATFYAGALDLVEDDRQRLDLLCRLVRVQAHEGNVVAARRNRERALAVARRLGTGVTRALTAYDAPVTWSIQPDRRIDEPFVAALREALAGTGPGGTPGGGAAGGAASPGTTPGGGATGGGAADADARDEVRCRLLATLTFELEGHDDEECVAISAEALRLARRLGRPELVCLALNARYFVLLTPYRRDELEAVGRELVELGAAAGLPGYQMQGHHALFMVSLGRNDLAAARYHADRALEHSTTGQLGLALGVLSMLDTLIMLIGGEFERAAQRYSAAAEQIAAAGGANAFSIGMVGRFVARLAGGLPQDIPEMTAAYESIPKDLSELLVRALVAEGRHEEARTFWEPGWEARQDYYWLIRLALRAENAIALGDREVGERCYRGLLPWDGELAGLSSGSVTLGPVAHVLGDLAEFLGRDGAAHYAKAVRVAEQVGSPHWARRAAEAQAGVRRRRAGRR